MSTDAPSATSISASLPDDPVVCQQMIRELLAALRERDRELVQVRHRLDQLLRRLYGPRAEKLHPDQLLLFATTAIDVASAIPIESPAPAEVPAQHRGHGRRRLPANLTRVQVRCEVPEAERICPECHKPCACIGEDVSEQLDYQPASLFVIQRVRPKYACPECQQGVRAGHLEPQPIDKGLPGSGLLAHVVVSKYADHLPLHRLERIFQRQGVELSRSTLCDWVAATARLLTPLYALMTQRVRQSRVIWTDDTPVPVLDEKRDSTRQGRMWVYLGDSTYPYAVFEYTPTHARDGPQQFLKGFQGYLQADAFVGYDAIYTGSQGAIREVACWAHARRKFYDARTTDPERAHAALAWVRKLYDVEDQAKGWTDAERAAYRQERARPLLVSISQWLSQQQTAVLPKSPIGQAIAYTQSNWHALNRYPEAGFLSIDNNLSERTLRPVAIGRKNWLFAGSDKGGRTAAVLFSFTATCRRLNVNPFAYLQDVLTRLPMHPVERLPELLPDQRVTPLPTANFSA
jgi:transposase